jgi:hypothetical protein
MTQGISTLGYADSTGIRVFQGTVDGTLATEPRGASGFNQGRRQTAKRRSALCRRFMIGTYEVNGRPKMTHHGTQKKRPA